jgi:putative GTP pyrophosphokinase
MINNILKEYDEKEKLYFSFCNRVELILKSIIEENSINIHQITSRVKDKESLKNKITKKISKYLSLSDITDIVGIRIITYFEDEVVKIANIITKEFVIDVHNSIDKRNLDIDRFGYRSLHYVIQLPDSRLQLTENKKFEKLKAELQIRSILQHSWAEIEHDLGYKQINGIPSFARRNFYSLAALLEIADREFVNLRNLLNEYENNIDNLITQDNEKVLIDKISLLSFINNNKYLYHLDTKIAQYQGVQLEQPTNESINQLLDILSSLNIATIGQLDNRLRNNGLEIIENYEEKDSEERGSEEYATVMAVRKGISIAYINKTIINSS